jgi:malate dehydrogenase (oxaloacetate-decarboxylating)(NADP+)
VSPEDQLRVDALQYHEYPVPGKISIAPTKALANQRDLSLAYSPGVAYACTAIQHDPKLAARYTARANLVAVVTNGTAVLGLGNIGAMAGKPVMEGKGCLFKKFAGIDVFDIEIGETDPDRVVEVVAALEPTFGGINLEDIKAPECFYIERKLRERMKIPVFHDDQHGTAIVTAAAVLNGIKIVGKDIGKVKLVASGAGAAAIACLDLLVRLGLNPRNILVADSKGIVHKARGDRIDPDKARYAQDTSARTLADAIPGADIFLGLSTGGVLKPEMVAKMADKPIILAMANPEPEIRPELAKQVRPDVIIGTGRSDYPNQVNNSLCFPFIFRGALDCGATTINEEMKLAAVRAIADIAQAEPSELVALAYGEPTPAFGPDYLIPRAFDPRLITNIPPAVAKAAMETGVATRPIEDFHAYRDKLTRFVYQSGPSMEPVFAVARKDPKRVAYAEGEDERVLRAAQVAVDEGIARPVLIGRTDIIAARIAKLGLRLKLGENCEGVNILDDPRYRDAAQSYYQLARRRGVSLAQAREEMRTRSTLVAAILMHLGDADAMLCGTLGDFRDHLKYVRNVIGTRAGVHTFGEPRSERRADRRDDAARRRAGPALRAQAERGDGVAFQFRDVGSAVGAEDARGDAHHRRQGARSRGGRRDARGHGLVQDAARYRVPRIAPGDRCQPAHHAERGRGEHHVQRVAHGGGGRHHHRGDPARRGQVRPHPDAVVDGPAHREHDSGRGRRCGRGALNHSRNAPRAAGPGQARRNAWQPHRNPCTSRCTSR